MDLNINNWVLNGSFDIHEFGNMGMYSMFFRINNSALAPIHALSIDQNELNLKLLSFGDDDFWQDCFHEAINVEVYASQAQ